MLKGIDPILSPELLQAMASMGHGDTIVIADGNFPAATMAKRLYRLPGIPAPRVLEAVMSLLPLDTFVEKPVAVMQVVGDPAAVPPPVKEFQAVMARMVDRAVTFEVVERYAFYERAKAAFAVVATGESRPYGNVIVTKGSVRAA
jgi:L-fucose mutarotase